jgi:TRAP-type C4-dicarboxylate transport system permease small subunit
MERGPQVWYRGLKSLLAALYIHALALVILVVFSRNAFSTAIRSTLLPLLR